MMQEQITHSNMPAADRAAQNQNIAFLLVRDRNGRRGLVQATKNDAPIKALNVVVCRAGKALKGSGVNEKRKKYLS
jgi:nucleoid DNA-binding protein